jgi:hypothetical protein
MKDMLPTADIQNQIIDAFTFRHACKVFDPDAKIPEDQFATILEAARLSPSSFGMEPWQLLILDSPDKRELFRDFTWGANGAANGSEGQLRTASHFGIFLAHTGATMKYDAPYINTHLKEVKDLPEEVIAFYDTAYRKFQEQDFGLLSSEQIAEWSARQVYIALGNMMTSAALMGIDSCPIEGFELTPAQAVLQEHFGVDPAEYKPAVMVAFGYRAADPVHPKTRRPLDMIVRRV